MFFGLSEEQEQFQDYVKKFLADNVTVDEIRKIANGEDEALAKEIAGRIGITPEMYKQVLSHAKKQRAKYERNAQKRFNYWEIGSQHSFGIGPVHEKE